MSQTVIEQFYRTIPDAAPRPRTLERQLMQLAPFLERREGGRLLDVGCNDGKKAQLIGMQLGVSEVIGIDYFGQGLLYASCHSVTPIAIDLNVNASLPFVSRSFDIVHVGDVIEHLFSPDILLKEIARLLTPTGYAIITTPNLASWRNRLILILGWQPFDSEVSTEVKVGNPLMPEGPLAGHIRLFTPRALQGLAEHHGLLVDSLGGRFNSQAPHTLPIRSRLLMILDRCLARFAPSFCDGIILKVRLKEC